MTTNDKFNEPETIEIANKRRDEIKQDIIIIQTQLGTRNRLDTNGKRLSDVEFWQWRQKAKTALSFKLDELRKLNQWIRAYNTENRVMATEVDDIQATIHEIVGRLFDLRTKVTQLEQENRELRKALDEPR